MKNFDVVCLQVSTIERLLVVCSFRQKDDLRKEKTKKS
uniref:Bm13573 n=1 Tax=Brugia malayi TaxID=6279 RepID=A0A1I9G9M2_BRUMA|nr:Bm13573 [Brugia malayi]